MTESYPKTTGTLKKSYSDDQLVNHIRILSYLNAHQYRNLEFPEPLEGRRNRWKVGEND